MADMNLFQYQGNNDAVKTGADMVNKADENAQNWARLNNDNQYRQATIKQQQAELLETQKMHEFEVGKQKTEEYKDLVMMPNGPLKNNLLDGFQGKYANTQHPIKDSWLVAAKDENMKDPLTRMMQAHGGLSVTDPEAFKAAVADSNVMFGRDATMKFVESINANVTNLNRSKLAAEATKSRTQGNQDIRVTSTALKEADTALAAPLFQLNSANRFDDVVKKYEGGEIVGTKNFLNSLTTEYAKMMVGVGKFTEGSQERASMDSYAQRVNEKIGQIKNAPQDADIGAFVGQLKSEIGTMKETYMNQVDATHEQLRSGWADQPTAQKAVDNKFRGVRSGQTKLHGQWLGYTKDGSENVTPINKGSDKAKEAAPAASASEAPAKKNAPDPVKVGKAKMFKFSLDKMTDSEKKDAIKKMKTVFSAEEMKAAGY